MISKIAHDLGIELDASALEQQARAKYEEIEETLRVFEATRAEEE